jgi:hypothetical protein
MSRQARGRCRPALSASGEARPDVSRSRLGSGTNKQRGRFGLTAAKDSAESLYPSGTWALLAGSPDPVSNADPLQPACRRVPRRPSGETGQRPSTPFSRKTLAGLAASAASPHCAGWRAKRPSDWSCERSPAFELRCFGPAAAPLAGRSHGPSAPTPVDPGR